MKNRVKCRLMDEILHGKEIFITVSGDYSKFPEQRWILYGGEPYRELFVWNHTGPIAVTTNPVTLKDALTVVETHWQDRVKERLDDTHP